MLNSKEFIDFLLDEFIDNVDTDYYYEKFDNMTREELYYYFVGKFDEIKKQLD